MKRHNLSLHKCNGDPMQATSKGPVTIHGCSDDLIEIGGVEYPLDEFGCYDNSPREHFVVLVGTEDAGLLVRPLYACLPGCGGTWAMVCEPVEEDVPCPWAVSVTVEKYWAKVRIGCPEGTPVAVYRAEEESDE